MPKQLDIRRFWASSTRQALLILSLLVTLAVFWSLKLTGITMAGEAFCGMDEHAHGDDCLRGQLICEIPEVQPHAHSEDCLARELACTLPEGEPHTHTEECHETTLICDKEESDTYTHGPECFRTEENLICGLAEMAQSHYHSEDCYLPLAGEYTCGLEETEGHIHTDACYEALESCPLEEHIHVSTCYSDLSADLETSDDWEMTLAGLQRSPRTVDNLLAVARSQLGYTESTRNFQLDENGIQRGITRYGQWYGNPYGQWSAMFASFCLTYAGVDVPVSAGPETMRVQWENEGLYAPAAEAVPQVGYLLFLDYDGNGAADAVAITTELDPTYTAAIEGDREDQVMEVHYEPEDSRILGYGLVPMEDDTNPQVLPGSAYIAQATVFDESLLSDARNSFVLYTPSGSGYYAIDGNGNAVPVYLDAEGAITADVAEPAALLWHFTPSEEENGYLIQNNSTGKYLYSFSNNGGGLVSTTSQVSQVIPVEEGLQIQSGELYPQLDDSAATFRLTAAQEESDILLVAAAQTCTVWLDGTGGGVDSMLGASNQKYTVSAGEGFRLPNANDWALHGPDKYDYVLRGWYDVKTSKYYAPGSTVTITEDTVFYADYVARSYDIGEYNAHVVDTVSTNSFITTQLFDYNYLFNVLSADAQVNVNANSHSESWSIVRDENVNYENRESLNFIFLDYRSDNTHLDYPNNRQDGRNQYVDGADATLGIYSEAIGNALFSTNEILPGKNYLGTGDHLFQLMEDPNDPHYGYYYYDSSRNAASYNQSEGRFYVYDYLEATNAEINDTKTDFLPLNSPYANSNGNSIPTRTDATGKTKYVYDAKYADSGNQVSSNYAYGMKMDIRFYLPNKPGTEGGNQDLYGNDMVFEFSGDDDLWVLVDGKLALDIGGIHQAETGSINFTTGEVMVCGQRNDALSAVVSALEPGEHTLTVMYLERGASHSNCAIYFTLAPRYSFSIQKEDVLTRDVLNGAQFSVYQDEACTVPAVLWESHESYLRNDPSTNVFTVVNGVANMWGMGAGNTYYIKETRAPDNADYGLPNGIIKFTLDKQGAATYSVMILPDANGNISGGFTVHGFRVDDATQQAYIIATNAPEWADDTTSVQAQKFWADGKDHSGESVTVYLTVTDPDGTVRRLQEAQLNSEKDWQHTWENLPKTYEDGTPIQYGVEEAYVSGYYSAVEKVDQFTVTTYDWAAVSSLENGKTYLLKVGGGFIASLNANQDTGFQYVDEATAKSSPLAQWTVSVVNGKYRLTNGAGQTITFYYNNGNPTDFYACSTGIPAEATQDLSYATENGQIRLFYDAPNGNDYYLSYSMTDAQKFLCDTSHWNGMLFSLMTQTATSSTKPAEGDYAYQITNTPLDRETSVTVHKVWRIDSGDDPTLYQQAQVTVKLLANGKDTGRTVTLSLKNGWVDVFRGLPYTDSSGVPIQYTVEESWDTKDWLVIYGEIKVKDGTTPTYETTVTNHYRWDHGVELPSTGSPARMLCTLCGSCMMLFPLVYGIGSRRKRERRMQ